MTRKSAPVILPDGSALLPDGTHVPAHAIAYAVDLIAHCCELLADMQAQVVAEAEAVRGE